MTLFHILPLFGPMMAAFYGMELGSKHFGAAGGISGTIIGGCLGLLCGHIPFILTLKLVSRRLGRKSTEELRTLLGDPDYYAPNTILLELQSRGEDIRQDLLVIMGMLVSTSSARRGQGWAALASAFPDLVEKIPDYRAFESADTCRLKIAKPQQEIQQTELTTE